MLFYIEIMFFLLFLAFVENKKVTYTVGRYYISNKIFISRCALIVLLLAVILRSKSVGGDLINYERTFKYWSSLNFFELFSIKNSDIGFVIFNWGIGQVFDSVYALMAISAILILVLVFIVLNKYSSNISFSLFCYASIYLSGILSGIRQEIAVAIILFSIIYVEKKELGKFMLCCIFAASFHSTAIIGILLQWFVYKEVDRMLFLKYVFGITGTVFILLFGISFVTSLYKINDYSQLIVRGEGIKLFILRGGIIFVSIIIFKIYSGYGRVHDLFLKMYSLGWMIQILALGFSLLTRLTRYFSIAIIILLPNMLKLVKGKFIKFIAVMIVVMLSIAYFIFTSRENSSGIIPYRFFWQSY